MRRVLLLLGVGTLALGGVLALQLLSSVPGGPAASVPGDRTAPAPSPGRPSPSLASPHEGADEVPPPRAERRVVATPPEAPAGGGWVGPHRSLWGRVLDGERPVARFTLVIARLRAGPTAVAPSRHPLADPLGRFELDLPAGAWTVRAIAGDRSTGEPVEVLVPRLEELVLELAPASRVSGRVLDPRGAPAAADVFSLEHPRPEHIVTSGPDGSFTLVLPQAGHHRLVALQPGRAPSEPLEVELAPGEHLEGVELGLRVGARLAGRVLDRRGRGEAGVHVTLRAQGPIPTRPAAAPTDASGWFELLGVPPGVWQVSVREDQQRERPDGPLRLALVELADGDDVELVLGGILPEAVRVRGVALAADGTPLADADLVTLAEGEQLLSSANQVELSDDGRFDVLLARPGRFVFALQDDGRLHSFPVHVPPAGLDALVLRVPGGEISCRVLDASGAPVPRAVVRAWRVDELGFLERFGEAEPARADGDGAFVFTALPPGTWRLEASHGQALVRLGAPIPLEDGGAVGPVVLRLGAGGVLKGVVIDGDGARIEQASVFVRDVEGAWMSPTSAVTLQRGEFVVRIPPGAYTLLARSPGHASVESEPVEVPPGGAAEVELVVVPATTLELALLDARGLPLPARFRVEDARGRRMSGVVSAHERSELLREGFSTLEVRVGPLVPGRYRVLATAPDGRAAAAEVTVAAEPLRRVELRAD